MNILVTNDDGYGAWGITALIKSLEKKHNVFVLAPDSNRSGNSTHISFMQDIELTKVTYNHWITPGTPADCSLVGLKSNLFDCKIDAVVSGINKGQNIGTDIIYSGTCGAAKQAVLAGVPGIAVSMQLSSNSLDWDDEKNWNFSVLADFVTNNLEKLISICDVSDKGFMSKNTCSFVNINAYSLEKFKGVKFTEPCFRNYGDESYNIVQKDSKYSAVIFLGQGKSSSRNYSDYQACEEGYISISKVFAEPICSPIDKNLDTNSFSL